MGFFSRFKNNQADASQQSNSTEESQLTMLDSGKIKAVVDSLTLAEPLFQQAGFQLQQLEIVLGAAPRVKPQFKKIAEISQEDEKHLLEQIKQEKLLLFIFTSLFKSAQMQSVMKNSKLEYYGMEIDITAEPSVRTIFKLNNS